jgi:hypothetical protein
VIYDDVYTLHIKRIIFNDSLVSHLYIVREAYTEKNKRN